MTPPGAHWYQNERWFSNDPPCKPSCTGVALVLAYPPTIEILKALLGEWLRFDHTFGMHMTSATPVQEGLHGGSLENQRSFWYQWAPGGVMHNGLIKVLYPLNDVNPGDGGFICVPGSHKSNIRYRPPEES